MYHIKRDKRSEASARLICAGLLDCLREMDFDEISISELQRRSGVSRSTFYRNFDRIEDVLSLLCDQGFQSCFQDRAEDTPVHLAVFRYWYRTGFLLEAIIRAGRTDLFLDSFRRCLEENSSLARFFPEDGLDYFVSTVSYVMVGTLVTWVRRGRKESEQQLMAALASAFSAVNAFGILSTA